LKFGIIGKKEGIMGKRYLDRKAASKGASARMMQMQH